MEKPTEKKRSELSIRGIRLNRIRKRLEVSIRGIRLNTNQRISIYLINCWLIEGRHRRMC